MYRNRMLVWWTLSLLNVFVVTATAATVNGGGDNVVFMDCMEPTDVSNESTAAVDQRIVETSETPERIAVERQKLILGLLDGTLNIDRSIDSLSPKDGDSNRNVVISPISIAAAMSLVLLGSRGETKTEVGSLLFGMDVSSVINTTQNNGEHYKYLGLLLNYFEEKSGEPLGSQVNLAKAIFVQNNYNIMPNFIKVAKESLKSEVISVDYKFNGPQAQQTINKWVSNQTHGKINNILPIIPFPETKTIITSAVYFMGEWETPFFVEYTKTKPFYFGQNVDGRKLSKQSKDVVYVPMMIGNSDVLYHKNDEVGLRAIGLPYKGKKFVMYFVLPHLITLRDLIAKMNGNTLQNITKNTKLTETTYFVPKMTLESSTNLRPVLQNLGINKIFDPTKADFSNMASDPGTYISDILHKVQIVVDEIGTVASASTTVTMTRGGLSMFNVNRPFLFFIHHVESDTVVFWGTVHKPTPYSTTPPDAIRKKM